MRRALSLAILVAIGLSAGSGVASAQGEAEWDPHRVLATRSALEQLKGRLLEASRSSAYSSHLRATAISEAGQIDRRLADGDFRPGDRLFVQVEGEVGMTDTFTVGPGRDISMQVVGAVPLAGVLRADVEPYLVTYLGKFLRSPRVHARPLISVTVTGHVAKPGFYTVPVGVPMTQVLTDAFGPTPESDLGRIQILRGGQVVLGGPELRLAMSQGRTLEQLGVQAGDQIDVGGGQTDFYRIFQTIAFALGIPLTVFSLVRLVKP